MTNGNVPQPGIGEITCITCKNKLAVKMPVPNILNGAQMSLIGFLHTDMEVCPTCETRYLLTIEGVSPEGNIILRWVRMVKVNDQSVVAPTPENIKHAMDAQT